MNKYKISFFSTCPNNGHRIPYALRITTRETIMAETIEAEVSAFLTGFHEKIADALFLKFGGSQRLSARHGSVLIVTTRP